jgi:hypothetical protein
MIGKLLALGLACCLTATMLVIAVHSFVVHPYLGKLATKSEGEVRRAPFILTDLKRTPFVGVLHRPDGTPDIVSIRWTLYASVNVSIRFGHGEGDVTFAGMIDPETGEFRCGPHAAAMSFPHFYHLVGRLRGPGLVAGKPIVYFEGKGLPVEGPVRPGYSWKGFLTWRP